MGVGPTGPETEDLDTRSFEGRDQDEGDSRGSVVGYHISWEHIKLKREFKRGLDYDVLPGSLWAFKLNDLPAMSIFDEEDNKTLKILGYSGLGFAALTVVLILLAILITG